VERFDGHKVFFSITKEDAQNYRKDWILHKSLFFLVCNFRKRSITKNFD
jgi:hypothetical protein